MGAYLRHVDSTGVPSGIHRRAWRFINDKMRGMSVSKSNLINPTTIPQLHPNLNFPLPPLLPTQPNNPPNPVNLPLIILLLPIPLHKIPPQPLI